MSSDELLYYVLGFCFCSFPIFILFIGFHFATERLVEHPCSERSALEISSEEKRERKREMSSLRVAPNLHVAQRSH